MALSSSLALPHSYAAPPSSLGQRYAAAPLLLPGRRRFSFTEPVERTIKGAKVRRNADAGNPAYLIEQDDKDRVLKSHSELRKAT